MRQATAHDLVLFLIESNHLLDNYNIQKNEQFLKPGFSV
jgi:hypothetical protein